MDKHLFPGMQNNPSLECSSHAINVERFSLTRKFLFPISSLRTRIFVQPRICEFIFWGGWEACIPATIFFYIARWNFVSLQAISGCRRIPSILKRPMWWNFDENTPRMWILSFVMEINISTCNTCDIGLSIFRLGK